MKNTGLSEADIATLAAGGKLNAGVAESPEVKAAREAAELLAATEATRLAAEASAAAALLAGETPEAKVIREAAEKATADAAALAASTKDTDIVAFLKGEIASKDAVILASTLKTTALEAQVAATETTHAALLDIARGAVGNMRIALGGSVGDSAALSDLAAVTEHKTLTETFKAKFKVGGVAGLNAEPGAAAAPAVHNHLARVSAAKGK